MGRVAVRKLQLVHVLECVVGVGRGEFGFWAHEGGVFARSFSVGVSVIAGVFEARVKCDPTSTGCG